MGDLSCEPTDLDVIFMLTVARATARALGANGDEADESAQETVVRLWSKWDEPHIVAARAAGRRRWYGYVRTTAKRKHYDLIRAHHRRERRNNLAAGGRPEPLPTRPGTVASTPQDVSGIDDFVVRRALAEEIDRLPSRQRTVAALVLLDGLSVADVAIVLEVQAQSVRKSLRAARDRLQKSLAPLEHEWL